MCDFAKHTWISAQPEIIFRLFCGLEIPGLVRQSEF